MNHISRNVSAPGDGSGPLVAKILSSNVTLPKIVHAMIGGITKSEVGGLMRKSSTYIDLVG